MHGLGNDMMVVDCRELACAPTFDTTQIRAWSNRKTGIGFDQLMTIESPSDSVNDARYRIFNADGGAVEQCGNGVRCVAAAIAAKRGVSSAALTLESPAGLIHADVQSNGAVSVNMGIPDFTPAAVPIHADARNNMYSLEILGEIIDVAAVSVGNPHAVVIVDDVTSAPLQSVGQAIGASDYFPEGVNVGFAEIVDRDHVRLRVLERGVGETRACGTGACAAMACLRELGHLDASATITLPGGSLVIDWAQLGEPITMTGPATFAFEGCITL